MAFYLLNERYQQVNTIHLAEISKELVKEICSLLAEAKFKYICRTSKPCDLSRSWPMILNQAWVKMSLIFAAQAEYTFVKAKYITDHVFRIQKKILHNCCDKIEKVLPIFDETKCWCIEWVMICLDMTYEDTWWLHDSVLRQTLYHYS
jgi:AAA+ ATPase superfamily predicted ATPase